MAEVSNLTDLTGGERLLARRKLKDMLAILEEPWMPSARAAQSAPYESLRLTDAAIMALAISAAMIFKLTGDSQT